MNCLNADVEDTAYIINRNNRKDKHIQISDFIFWWRCDDKFTAMWSPIRAPTNIQYHLRQNTYRNYQIL